MSSSRIVRVFGREVFDSRGRPTVEVEVTCEDSRPGRAIVPSGASTGRFEALELRDCAPSRLNGLGVRTAVANVNGEIASALIGLDADDQCAIDDRLRELDGTPNKSRLGANAILGASLACAYAAAEAKSIAPVDQFAEVWSRVAASPIPKRVRTSKLGVPSLPLPMVNMISGGKHAGGNLDFQDYLILPVGAASYREAFDWIVTVYWQVGRRLTELGFEGVLVGDEGGFGPKLTSNEQALSIIVEAIEQCGLRPGEDVAIGLDVASSHFFDAESGTYRLKATGNERLSSTDVIELLSGWCNRYPIISIEDGLAEDDWNGWTELTRRLGDKVQLIGDDFFVTNPERLRRGIDEQAANAVLIKLNQIGTLSETLTALRLAIDHDYWPVVSARSGETEDATIADLVVATGAGQLKVGSVARSERLAKYNQVLRLAERDDFAWHGSAIFETL
ncbi:phosphopyruvate hydratase [bacterium]|nr:phosphopyruvate hydratase [bacterium]